MRLSPDVAIVRFVLLSLRRRLDLAPKLILRLLASASTLQRRDVRGSTLLREWNRFLHQDGQLVDLVGLQ